MQGVMVIYSAPLMIALAVVLAVVRDGTETVLWC